VESASCCCHIPSYVNHGTSRTGLQGRGKERWDDLGQVGSWPTPSPCSQIGIIFPAATMPLRRGKMPVRGPRPSSRLYSKYVFCFTVQIVNYIEPLQYRIIQYPKREISFPELFFLLFIITPAMGESTRVQYKYRKCAFSIMIAVQHQTSQPAPATAANQP